MNILKKAMLTLLALITVPLISILQVYASPIITTIAIKEKSGVTTQNYPLTFGQVFKKGDIKKGLIIGYNNNELETQLDIKSYWEDGSIKHAVISTILPKIEANQNLSLSIISGELTTNDDFLSKSDILKSDINSKIQISNLNGSGYSGVLSSSLRNTLNDTNEFKYWLKGNICTEIIVDNPMNDSLNATWEARFYPSTSFGIRISNCVENVEIGYRGNVSYDLGIIIGDSNPQVMYERNNFLHVHNTRWRKVYWLGKQPPEIEIRYNIDYLIDSGLVMNYNTAIKVDEDTIASEYAKWKVADTEIGGNGSIKKYFPEVGGRPDLGIEPKWTALYLLSMDNRMREIMVGNAHMAGHCPMHYRESDPTKNFHGHVMSIDDRPDVDRKENLPPSIGDLDSDDWTIDRSHQPSLAYIPYLITGEYWYLQELYFWAGYNLFFENYRRNGNYGLLYGEMRGVAWALRTISNAAAIAPDNDIEKKYFSDKLRNNIEWLLERNTETAHGLHIALVPREHEGKNGFPRGVAPWQHDFIVITLSDMLRKQSYNTDKLQELRDRLGLYTVGRFTNHPVFPKWDGAGYWWPLTRIDGDYYSSGSWSEHWSDILAYTGQTGPHSDFSHYDYPYSYAFIARGALACITHLPKGNEAFELLDNNLSTEKAAKDPTWFFSPASDVQNPSEEFMAPPINLKIIN